MGKVEGSEDKQLQKAFLRVIQSGWRRGGGGGVGVGGQADRKIGKEVLRCAFHRWDWLHSDLGTSFGNTFSTVVCIYIDRRIHRPLLFASTLTDGYIVHCRLHRH